MNKCSWKLGLTLAAVCVATLTGLAIAEDTGRPGRRLFRCESQGTVTYSDTGCAAESAKVEVDASRLNSFTVEETPPGKATINKRTEHHDSKGVSIAEEQQKHKQRCKELADRLSALTDKLWRDASTRKHADQSRRLEVQQRKLEEERRAQKCHQ